MKTIRRSLFSIVLAASFLLLAMSLLSFVTYADSENMEEWSSDVSITENTTFSERVNVSGNVTLTIADGVTLTCKKGISVRSGNSLTINGPGTLMAIPYTDFPASSVDGYAGIGGDPTNPNAGTITINSGNITAQAGMYAAGIGGADEGSGGTVVINGGNVTARGIVDGGAAIGSGRYNGYYDVTINGGKVDIGGSYWVYEGSGAIGAGSGKEIDGDFKIPFANGTIRIYGGQVNVSGGHIGSGTVRYEGSSVLELSWTNPDDCISFQNAVFVSSIKYLKPFYNDAGGVVNPGTSGGSGSAFDHYGTRRPAVKTINYYITPDELYTTQKVQINTTTTAPEGAPTWEKGKAFLGWCRSWHDAEKGDDANDATDTFDFSTSINQDVNLYAGWDRKCTIVLSPGSGAGGLIKQIDALYGNEYTLPDPKAEEVGHTPPVGQMFTGWKYTDGEFAGNIGDTITIEGDDVKNTNVLSLTSVASNYYEVIYRPDTIASGQSNWKRYPILPGRSHTLLDNSELPGGGFTAPDEHLEFAGWDVSYGYSTDKTTMQPGEEITLNKNAYATAKWINKKYRVTFMDQDGAAILSEKDYEYDTPAVDMEIPENPDKDPIDGQYAYTFQGWATKPNQTTGVPSSKLPKVSGDIVYYAAFSADPDAASYYADYVSNADEVVQFNGMDWYIIEDNSTEPSAGTVTLFARDYLAYGKRFSNGTNNYAESEVRTYLDGLTAEGGAFTSVVDLIEATDLSDEITGAKLYLLTVDEGLALPESLRKCVAPDGVTGYHFWWTRSPYTDPAYSHNDCAWTVCGERAIRAADQVVFEYGVRPALKLQLDKVVFEKETSTFKRKQTVSAPTPATDLEYNEETQTLLTVPATVKTGNTDEDAITYSLDKETWSADYPAKKDAGAYKVYYKVAANDTYGEYMGFVKTKISPSPQEPPIPAGITAIYGQQLKEIALPEGWVWEYPNAHVGDVGSSTHYADYTGSNYKQVFLKQVPIIISQAPNTATVNIEGWTKGEEANAPVYTADFGKDTAVIEYKLKSESDDNYSNAAPTEPGEYTVRVTIPETANYVGTLVTADFEIAERCFTIKFVDEDDTLITEKRYAEGTKAEDIEKPEEPTKEATAQYTYSFAGWDPEISDVTKDATYKATYEAVEKTGSKDESELTPAQVPSAATMPATTVNINNAAASAVVIRQAIQAAGGNADTLVLGKKVKKISKRALAGTGIKTIVVESKKLKKKTVKGSLKSSAVTTVKVEVGNTKMNKKYVKKYKKIFTKKNAGKKVKVKR